MIELFFIPSLEHMNAVTIAILICRDFEFKKGIHLYSSEKDIHTRIVSKALGKVSSLPLPTVLQERIAYLIHPIFLEIHKWRMDHYRMLGFNIELEGSICWKSEGTIDRHETALALVQKKKYRYHGGVVDWSRVAMQNLERYFWNDSGSPVWFRYLYPELPSHLKSYYLSYIMDYSLLPFNNLRFILAKMDENLKKHFFQKYSYVTLEHFLHSPFQDIFMEVADLMWEDLPITDFLYLLNKLRERVTENWRDFDYSKLLREFWYHSPAHCKEFAKTVMHDYNVFMNGIEKK
ncbi:uncharacterized protein NPIL_200541 [Nephila pilipes]|uniref:Uncharacterized protein n=1 Tax=Nephila pilipes TaxID=299642 RepID=A0A8X6PGZ1_NEPPI|nr:uncharacterized protein NPIL_200541 [Nephila pilipes]